MDDYEQAMADVLAELGVEAPPITSADIVRTEPGRVALEAEIPGRQQAWGEAWTEVFRLASEQQPG